MKQPTSQVPVALQYESVPQLAPLARVVHSVVLVAGWHVWQAFAEFAAPDAKNAPPMKQPAEHEGLEAAPLQTFPVPQLVPRGRGLQLAVLTPGLQSKQGLPGSSVPGAWVIPPMPQPVPHAPAVQT
jgi:hypothetical protein